MKSLALVSLLTATLTVLTACGGGGGGATYDLIKEIYQNTSMGGYQSIRNIVKDDTTTTFSTGCGYLPNNASNQQVADAQVVVSGGTVTSSTANEYCATAGGQMACLEKVERAYIQDGRSAGYISIEMTLTGLVQAHETHVAFDTSKNYAEINSVTFNPNITQGQNCPQPTTTQTIDAINGAWSGYKINYNTISKTGTSVAATLSCVNQLCTISDSTSTVASLSAFSNYGNWKSAAGAPKFVGASLSSDKLLLSMFVCSAPLDESKTFDSCGFYSFKR